MTSSVHHVRVSLAAFFFVVIAACAAPPPTWSVAADADQEAVLPAKYVRNYFLVDVQLEDRGPYVFVLDTGSSKTVVDDDVAREIVGGRSRPGMTFTVHRARAGALRTENLDAFVHEMDPLSLALGEHVDGILGYNAFLGVVLTLDYPNGEARVRGGPLSETEGAANAVELVGRGRPYIDLEVQGKEYTFLIDSGSLLGIAVVTPDALRWKSGPVPTGASFTINGFEPYLQGRLEGNIACGPVTLVEPIATIDSDISYVGSEVLRNFKLTFDSQSQRLLIDGDGRETIDFDSVLGIGAATQVMRDHLLVQDVFPDTPSAAAGLEPGDRITAIDGKPVRFPRAIRSFSERRPGDSLELEVERNGDPGHRITVEVTALVP